MKSGVIVAIAIVVLLAVVAGYFLFTQPADEGTVCAQDVQQCPDGSSVGRNPANNCEFFACPRTNNQPDETETQFNAFDVNMSGFAFVPSTLEISVNDVVLWTNQDFAPHTITSDSGNELNSPNLERGMSYMYTFTTPGTYSYHCAFHSGMKGKVIVK